MGDTQTSTNMSIVTPVVGLRVGPTWASDLFTALITTIDAHDHSSGKGVPIGPAGMSINADLSFGGFNATVLRSARFASQGAPLALGSDLGCLSNVGGDAYWNDGAGNKIRLTQGGQINTNFSFAQTKLNVTGNYTILPADIFTLFFINTTAGVTMNLPASNTLVAGRTYFFLDYLGTSEAHPITVVPNGTDTIQTVNASVTLAANFGLWTLQTDAQGHWVLTYSSLGYERANGLSFGAAVVPLFNQAQSTTGAGALWTVVTQAAKTGSGANGGNLALATGVGDGAGVPGSILEQPGGVTTWSSQPWVGTVNTQQRILRRAAATMRTTGAATGIFYTYAVPNNSAMLVVVEWNVRDITTPANSASGVTKGIVLNNAGTMGQAFNNLYAPDALGAAIGPSVTCTFSGTTMQLNAGCTSTDTVDWTFSIRFVNN